MAERPRRRPVRPAAAAARRPVRKKPASGEKPSPKESKKPTEESKPVAAPVVAETPAVKEPADVHPTATDTQPVAAAPAPSKPEVKKEKPSNNGGGPKGPSKGASKQKESKKGGGIIWLILFLLATGAAGYFFWKNQAISEELTAAQGELERVISENSDELANKEKEIQAMIKDYEAIKLERDALGLKNDELNSQVDALNSSLSRLRAAKSSGNSGELRSVNKDLEKQLAQLKLDLIAKDEEIVRLKHINNKLADHVDQLITKQGKMSSNLTSLSEKIEVASILHLDKMEVGYMNTKGKVITDEYNEFKGSKIDKIRVNFILADNKVASFGYKTFTFRLIDPEGKVMFDLGKGGGSFTMADGKTDFFTSEKNINFDNTETTEFFEYIQPRDYAAGVYKSELYADGHLVGEQNFTIQ